MDILAKKKERHQAFWDKSPTDRPLMMYQIKWNLFSPNFMRIAPHLHNKIITPSMIKADAYDEVYDEIIATNSRFECDRIMSLEPFHPVPWLEAVAGCRVHSTEEYMSSAPAVGEGEPYGAIMERGPDKEWEAKYFEILSYLRGRYEKEDCYIVPPILRGIFDVASALVSPTRLILDYYDQEEGLEDLFRYVTDISASFVEAQRHAITRHGKDSVSGLFHIWAPDFTIRLQEDGCALMNPRMFKELAHDSMKRLASSSCYSLVHMHPTAEHVLLEVCNIEEIRAIEMNIDDGFKNERIEDYIPMLHAMRDSGKCIVLNGRMSPGDIRVILREIGGEGLCLIPVVASPEEAGELNRAVGYSL